MPVFDNKFMDSTSQPLFSEEQKSFTLDTPVNQFASGPQQGPMAGPETWQNGVKAAIGMVGNAQSGISGLIDKGKESVGLGGVSGKPVAIPQAPQLSVGPAMSQIQMPQTGGAGMNNYMEYMKKRGLL